jgi:diguanylate cyclase (GGDEF)-like protein
VVEQQWVVQATRTARTVVLVTYLCTALLVGALALERVVLHGASDKAVHDVKTALRLADNILLEDERLTMSAHMAAATGDTQWVQRYEAHIPLIDAAIREATAMAPPQAAERFDQATRAANDRLVEMERAAFARVAAGDLKAAQSLLSSPLYAAQKNVLARGSDAFMDELQSAVDARLQSVERRSWSLIALLLVCASAAFLLLWRRLNAHLERSEVAFTTKQAEVSRLALYDSLTGLANRRYLHLQLEGSIARAARDRAEFSLLVIDLDGFKPINDRFGHPAGDAVLIEISRRLSAQVRKDEVAARLGGDEFVVVLNHSGSSEEPLRAAQRLVAALCEPVLLPQGEVRVGASVGVAFYPSDSTEAEDLVRKADVALYRAKKEGGGEVRFFQQSMDEEVRERAALELDLQQAIAQRHIVPYFQPLMDLQSGALTGFEVLARWHHPTRGLISPTVFVPIAEDTGQIDALTLCVMHAALTQARDWDPHLTIAVNIAPQQLKSEALADSLLGVLHATGFPATRFEVEITENALIGDLGMARRIVLQLKRHGVRVALDDFGTGYSSLSHLSELPFDKIKIDRSFIHTLNERRESATIVNAIIGLGRSLNLPTTAEGIESPADAMWLSNLGCHSGQGFLYSKPVPAHEVQALIERYKRHAVA